MIPLVGSLEDEAAAFCMGAAFGSVEVVDVEGVGVGDGRALSRDDGSGESSTLVGDSG